jgi:hypothetical protein
MHREAAATWKSQLIPMPAKSRSEILIERPKAAGYEPNREQDNARFKFIISPVTAGADGGYAA